MTLLFEKLIFPAFFANFVVATVSVVFEKISKFSISNLLFLYIQNIIFFYFSHKFKNKKIFDFIALLKVEYEILKYFWISLKYFIIMIVPLFVLILLLFLLNFDINIILKSNKYYDDYFKNANFIFFYFILILIVVPFSEEMFFRYVIFSHLRNIKFSFLKASMISSLLFSIGHFNKFLFAFCIGVFLCYVYEKEKNKFINFFIHSLTNLFAFFIQTFEFISR